MDESAYNTAKQYLRRTYTLTVATSTAAATFNIAGLKALADKIAESAFESVAITGQTFEGGAHQGQLVFPRMKYLQAVEELIAEVDSTVSVAPSRTTFPDFSQQFSRI